METEAEVCFICEGTHRLHRKNAPEKCISAAGCAGCDPCIACEISIDSPLNSPTSPSFETAPNSPEAVVPYPNILNDIPDEEEETKTTSLVHTVRAMKFVKKDLLSETDRPMSSLGLLADSWMNEGEPEVTKRKSEIYKVLVNENVEPTVSTITEIMKAVPDTSIAVSEKEEILGPTKAAVIDVKQENESSNIDDTVNKSTYNNILEADIDFKKNEIEESLSAAIIEPAQEGVSLIIIDDTFKEESSSLQVGDDIIVPEEQISVSLDQKRLSRERSTSTVSKRRPSVAEIKLRLSQSSNGRRSQSKAESEDVVSEVDPVKTSQELPRTGSVGRKTTIPRTGRRKKDGMQINMNQDGTSSGEPSPRTPALLSPGLQSVAGTLAKSKTKKYQRRGESPSRIKESSATVTNRPMLPAENSIKNISDQSDGPTGESLDNIKSDDCQIKEEDEVEMTKSNRRYSRIEVITEQLNESSRNSSISRDTHAKSLEFINEQGTTRRRTQTFNDNVKSEMAKIHREENMESAAKISEPEGTLPPKLAVPKDHGSVGSFPVKSTESMNSSVPSSAKKKANRISTSISNLFHKKAVSGVDEASNEEASAKSPYESIQELDDSPSPATQLASASAHKGIANPIAPGMEQTTYRRFKSFKEWSAINVHAGSRIGVFKGPKFTDEMIKFSDIVCTRQESESMQTFKSYRYF
jgi:hypothetical protein